jgi:hypothetical protein
MREEKKKEKMCQREYKEGKNEKEPSCPSSCYPSPSTQDAVQSSFYTRRRAVLLDIGDTPVAPRVVSSCVHYCGNVRARLNWDTLPNTTAGGGVGRTGLR